MIRLSIAMAKARLSPDVSIGDAEKAYHLLHFAMFKKKPKERMETGRRRAHRNADEEGGGDEEEELMDVVGSASVIFNIFLVQEVAPPRPNRRQVFCFKQK